MTTDIEDRLKRIETQNEAILKAIEKKKNAIFNLEDENKERGNWSGRYEFFLACLGNAVGLGNVWRFPYLCYKNGGGAFLIPYTIMLIFGGMPIFFLELSLGQFTSSGPLTCWKYSPLFQGIGIGMVATLSIQAIYYNMIVGWSFYYLFASFTSDLPWENCQSEWNSDMCIDYIPIVSNSTQCLATVGWSSGDDGACYNTNGSVVALYDQKLAYKNGIERELPTALYFDRYVTGSYYSDGLQDLGPIQWKIALCYLLACVLVVICLCKSIKSSGKAVYLTATFPYVVLLILFIRGLMLEGHSEGIEFYIKPDFSRLSESTIWKDAAVQIFFSLTSSWGILIALSSYNRFHNDVMRDAVLISVTNCLTSVFAGFVIFSYIGNLAHVLGVDVDQVAKSGPSLAFIVYPYAVTKLPGAPFWSIIFFLMLITLGLDSQFGSIETVVTSLMDVRPVLRNWKFLVVATVCSVFYLLGLTLTTEGGIYMLELLDTFSGSWNIMFIAICECLSISYVYGIRRFLQDIETMIGYKVCGCFPYFILKFWWAFNWCFATPGLVTFIMVFSWVKYTGLKGDEFPGWADVLGWLMSLIAVVAIVGGAIYEICRAGSLKTAAQPLLEWGPALVKHRALIAKYVPGFVVDPWGKESSSGAVDTQNGVNLQIDDENGKPQFYDSRYVEKTRV